jgi:hypothetical protein
MKADFEVPRRLLGSRKRRRALLRVWSRDPLNDSLCRAGWSNPGSPSGPLRALSEVLLVNLEYCKVPRREPRNRYKQNSKTHKEVLSTLNVFQPYTSSPLESVLCYLLLIISSCLWDCLHYFTFFHLLVSTFFSSAPVGRAFHYQDFRSDWPCNLWFAFFLVRGYCYGILAFSLLFIQILEVATRGNVFRN